jgi:hypothetical protein
MHCCVVKLLLVFISWFWKIVGTSHCLYVCNFPCTQYSSLEQTLLNMFIIVVACRMKGCYF